MEAMNRQTRVILWCLAWVILGIVIFLLVMEALKLLAKLIPWLPAQSWW